MTIQRRNVDFGLSAQAVPRDWCHDDAFQTSFLNALSLLFPEGEKFFVESVKQLRDKAPALDREIAGFIGQEAMHGKEHRALNDLIVEHGYASAPKIDAALRRFLRLVRKTLPPTSQLAVTCALEHFTAMLAESLLTDERMREDIHPAVRELWLWHALEESEHKAVAFDVYRAAGGGYVRRAAIMLVTTIVFFAAQAIAHARLMADRKILWKPWTWLRGAGRFWVWPGYLTRLVPAYLAYFRPGFHPNDRDTEAVLAAWRDQLFGDGGALVDRTRAIA
ncbi:MAG: metal-dependent hydrolase [Deltaproteobacteria bacterium]|nr:metal-dependent hydrolase [Deltaproteobacteria bacterium]